MEERKREREKEGKREQLKPSDGLMLEKGGGEKGKQPTDDCSIKKGTSGWREAKEKGTRESKTERGRRDEGEREGKTLEDCVEQITGSVWTKHTTPSYPEIFTLSRLAGNRTNTHDTYTRICDGSDKVFAAALFVFSSICVPGGDISAKCLNQ